MDDRMMMPTDELLIDLADLYKVFGDYSRIRILYLLMEDEVCVQDIADTLDMTQSAVSHQLKILKQNKLVRARRDGKSMYYSLADHHVSSILDMGREHLLE